MSGRIPWDRYSGDDIEATVAMMINRQYPRSTRITPSRGDGGIDILEPGTGSSGATVFQIKRFTRPLSSQQKKQIAESFTRVFDAERQDSRWADLGIKAWRLVTPWDPTPEAYTWLQKLPRPQGVEVGWDGLTKVDNLAAQYPEVVDYYLRDGRGDIESQTRNILGFHLLDSSEEQDAPRLAERLQAAINGLNRRDPHYRYGVRTGYGVPTTEVGGGGQVYSTFQINPACDTWTAIDVYARCMASVVERPITIRGQMSAPSGSALAKSLEDFVDLGTPFTTPLGTFNGELDAPGGLADRISDAAVTVLPTQDQQPSEPRILNVELLDPTGLTIAAIQLERVDLSSGSAGLRTVFRESNGVFEEIRVCRFGESKQTATFKLLPLVGQPVSTLVDGLRFLAHLEHPNQVRISRQHTPPHLGHLQDIPEALPTEFREHSRRLLNLVEHLVRLQQHTTTILKMPSESEISEQHRGWTLVLGILEGRISNLRLADNYSCYVVLPPGSAAPVGTFEIPMPLQTKVGADTAGFGTALVQLLDATLVSEKLLADGSLYLEYLPRDRELHYRLVTAEMQSFE